MRFATVGGITLHYTLEGSRGSAPLVFINSLGTDLRIWDQLISDFVELTPVIRYDKRGHGLSDCPPGPYSIRDHSDDLAGLLAHMKAEGAILAGISVGGLIALDYAVNHPERVRALVLCDTGAKIGTTELWNERIETIRTNGMDYLAEAILGRWFAPGFRDRHPAAYRGYTNMLIRTPPAGYIATCEAIRDADLREAARKVSAKALVLCGAEDAATPPALARELAETLPDARFELVEGAAHLPCVEQPGAMAGKMQQFLQEIAHV